MATALLITILIGAFIALCLTLQSLVTLARVRVPFVTTPDWVIDWLRTHADIKPKRRFVELGCGDARVLAALARRFPEAWFIGYELAWWPYVLARWRTRRLHNIQIERKNFMTAPLQHADAFFCYLITSVMGPLAAKLQRELRLGAVVYSHAFRLPNWTPIQTIHPPAAADRVPLLIYERWR